jgi:hypothetical protein
MTRPGSFLSSMDYGAWQNRPVRTAAFRPG